MLADAWSWTGLIVVLAVCGVISAGRHRGRRRTTWLLVVLTAPRCRAPGAGRLHTAASLNKHVGLGAWFAAIAAGYAVDRFIAAAPDGRTRTLTAAPAWSHWFPAVIGAGQSRQFSTTWPNSTSFIAIFRPLADHGTGRLLVEDPAIAEYYLPAGTQWQRWSSTRNIILPGGASTGGPSQRRASSATATPPPSPGSSAAATFPWSP